MLDHKESPGHGISPLGFQLDTRGTLIKLVWGIEERPKFPIEMRLAASPAAAETGRAQSLQSNLGGYPILIAVSGAWKAIL